MAALTSFHKPSVLVLGLAASVFGVWLGREGRRTSAWPTTEGEILVSRTVPVYHLPGATPRPYNDEEAEVLYTYSVQGKRYQGKGISMSPGLVPYLEETMARRVAARYGPGSRVTVYYDPVDARRSVLEPGASLESRVAILVGLGSLVVYGVAAWAAATSRTD